MADGTALFRFKQAYFTQLDLTTLNVMYDSPTNTAEFMGPDGLGQSCWFADNANGSNEARLLMSAPHWFEEQFTVTLVIQVLGSDTSYDQATVDQLAVEQLGKAIAILASDPGIGIADDSDIQTFTCLPAGWKYVSGTQTTGARAARFELDIEVTARLKLATLNGNPT
jgi:hypothetical protein